MKSHFKSDSFSTDNRRTSRLSSFYRKCNHKNFIPKYLDNALIRFLLNFANIKTSISGSDSLGPKLSTGVFMGLFRGIKGTAILCYDETSKLYVPLCTNNFRNSSGLAFYRIPKTRRIQRQYVRLFRKANLKLNSDSTPVCILLVFLEVKSPRHTFLQLHIFMFFFFQFHLPLCYFELF